MSDRSSAPGRRIILLRHAKAARPDGVADRDRPLAGSGRETAPLIGAYMAREGLIPDLALVSAARRTLETWSLVGDALPLRVPARTMPALYGAAASELLQAIHAVEPSVATLLLVGHNPGLGELAVSLSGSGDAGARRRLQEKVPTGSLAVIDFKADRWKDVSAGTGHLERFVTPHRLG